MCVCVCIIFTYYTILYKGLEYFRFQYARGIWSESLTDARDNLMSKDTTLGKSRL
jgi:hypothetical protein